MTCKHMLNSDKSVKPNLVFTQLFVLNGSPHFLLKKPANNFGKDVNTFLVNMSRTNRYNE